MHVREVREASREADFVASTDAIDSYGEIVEQVWRLDRFKKNPVILFAHNSREIPIGQAVRCEVVDGVLECTIRFASEKANPKAEQVWQSVLEKTLRAVSVGFNPGTVRYEKRNDREICVLSDNELFEISVTPIGANPEALAKMRARALAAQSGSKDPMSKNPENEKNQQADLEAKEASFLQSQKDLAAAREEVVELKSKLALVSERLSAVEKERDSFRDKSLELQVDALVNKKIFPSEKESFLELAQQNPALFEKMVGARKDLQLLSKVLDDGASVSTPTNPEDVNLVNEANKLGEPGDDR